MTSLSESHCKYVLCEMLLTESNVNVTESLNLERYIQEEKVESVFMFSHKINNTGYIIVKLYT